MMLTPYDIGEIAPGQQDVRWPLAFASTKRLNAELRAAIVGMTDAESDPEWKDVLRIAAPTLMIALFTECNAALVAVCARERGLTFAFASGSLAKDLAEGKATGSGVIYELVGRRFANARDLTWRHFLRDLAHGLLTNRSVSLGRQSTLVLSHNSLLQNAARSDSTHNFFYRSTGRLFRQSTADLTGQMRKHAAALAHELVGKADMMLQGFGAALSPPHHAQLAEKTGEWLARVAGDRLALDRGWRRRPQTIWTGTGGNYVTRQARAAVKRAGGEVVGFEHGGGGHIHRELGAEIINEFWLADRFVADTAQKAEVYRNSAVNSDLMREPTAFDGAPKRCATFGWNNEAGAQPIKRVLYVTTAFVGETCYPIQPLLPDPIYADWQGRLADGLAAQGFEVLIKQHPQGLRRGEPLVTSRAGRYLTGRFEDAMRTADAFVFDYPATTSLWEAICTRKPVLFVDLGLADWNPPVRALFEQRCAIVHGHLDEWNRPQADFAQMRRALQDAPMSDAFAEAYLSGAPRA